METGFAADAVRLNRSTLTAGAASSPRYDSWIRHAPGSVQLGSPSSDSLVQTKLMIEQVRRRDGTQAPRFLLFMSHYNFDRGGGPNCIIGSWVAGTRCQGRLLTDEAFLSGERVLDAYV